MMIKQIKKIIIFGILLLIALGVLKDQYFDTPTACLRRVQPFLEELSAERNEGGLLGSNKELFYNMNFWSLLPMGILKLSIVDGMDRYISMEADTNDSWIGNFFKASASFKSYFQENGYLPKLYQEQTRVKEKTRIKEIIFDQKELIAQRGDAKIKIPENTFDPLGAVLYAFTLPYERNPHQEVRFLSKEEIYLLKADLLENKDGFYKIKMEMRREDLSSNHGATITVWLTADERRIPLLFKSWTPAGPVSVVLKKINFKN